MSLGLTVYDRRLIEAVEVMMPGKCGAGEVVERLIRMGVVDAVRCKVLVIREYVNRKVQGGMGKVNAMYDASEQFSCSYDYVRRCMYYYKDVNLS